MKDIEIAKKHLKEENLTIILVKDKETIFKSKKRGISPIYELAKEKKDLARAGALGDKVIGKGAALLCKYIGVKEVYGELMSETAMEVLKKANIKFSYSNSTKYIENRDKTGLCPIEKRAIDVENGETMLEKIEEFLEQLPIEKGG